MYSCNPRIWYKNPVETGAPTLARIKRTDGKNLEQDVANPSEFTKNEATLHEVQAANLLVPQTTITVEAYRRELRRKKQIRYRKKQKDRMLHRGSENRKLELEIARLKARRLACLAPALPRSVWSSVAQFFQEFRRSFQGSEESTDNKTKMIVDAPNVIFNGERGIEAMGQRLKRIYLWFDRPEFDIRHFVEGSNNSLVATSILSSTITEKTLSHVFPHLCTDKRDVSLGRRLLGQRIAVYLVTRFEWDTTRGRISSVVTKTDLMKPMLTQPSRQLGSCVPRV
ncbi:hypothetical protein V7S43_007284 [Phytophthora oleae]|uniref:Uncharacterized protein n=1 Tax=Phytophthora oleae TaxID=2107226 RepID=A0ABD3FMP8_9STRA